MCIFGSDEPFYYLEKERSPDSGDYVRIFQSDKRSSTNNPEWKNLKYSAKRLWNGDPNCQFKIMFYSHSSSGSHKPYGEVITNLDNLLKGEDICELYQIGTNYKLSGATVKFENLKIEERPSFYDFLHSGWEINLSVAIDFTASNGPAQYPDSLHYLDPRGVLNQYQQALYNVGGILQHYDTDKNIPAFGFGAIPNYTGISEVSHCFHLNGMPNPECAAIDGLMQAYYFSLSNVKLYGPTFFSPFLKVWIDFIAENITKQLYHVILILTDGDIHDMDKTKDLIVSASDMPVSIIIIGVGDDEFELMNELDSDSRALTSSSGIHAKRDIVQFVKYNDFKHAGQNALAEEVLREIPEQVISFLMLNKIKI